MAGGGVSGQPENPPGYATGADKVTKHTYICSLHFIGGSGPTVEHPDPIDATASPAQVSNTNSDVTVMLLNRHRVRDQTLQS